MSGHVGPEARGPCAAQGGWQGSFGRSPTFPPCQVSPDHHSSGSQQSPPQNGKRSRHSRSATVKTQQPALSIRPAEVRTMLRGKHCASLKVIRTPQPPVGQRVITANKSRPELRPPVLIKSKPKTAQQSPIYMVPARKTPADLQIRHVIASQYDTVPERDRDGSSGGRKS